MEEHFLIVMDYQTGEIHIYKYKDNDSRSTEEIIEDYGHKKSDCHYMCTDELILKYH